MGPCVLTGKRHGLAPQTRALRPEEDTLTVAAGFIGDYPNAFYRLQRADLPAFTAAVQAFKSEADYHAFATRFAVWLTNPGFWAHSDAVQSAYRQWAPDIARDAVEQDRLEAYVRQRIESGDSIVGVYPPNEETKAAYQAWLAKR